MRLPLLLLFCIAATTASAQTTWHNLHFGESRDQLTSELTAQSMPVESTPDGALQTNSDVELPLPGLLYPIPMTATFHFDAASNLGDITLSLDIPAMHRYWGALGPDEAIFNFAADQFALALAGTYGAPIYTSAACNAIPENPALPCTLLWHGNQQSIELERTLNGHHLHIRYLPIANSL